MLNTWLLPAKYHCAKRQDCADMCSKATAYLECTAADSVCFIFIFFMSRSESQLVNEVQSHTHLLPLYLLAVPVLLIHLADVIHIVLQVSNG